jgi:hypothetical protein
LGYRFSKRANPFHVVCSFRFYDICNEQESDSACVYGKLYEINSEISFNIGGLLVTFLSQVISFVKFFFFIIHADASPFLLLCDNPFEL